MKKLTTIDDRLEFLETHKASFNRDALLATLFESAHQIFDALHIPHKQEDYECYIAWKLDSVCQYVDKQYAKDDKPLTKMHCSMPVYTSVELAHEALAYEAYRKTKIRKS